MQARGNRGCAGDRIEVAAVWRASSSLSASSTAFAISSMNSGMPSVRSMMSCRIYSWQIIIAHERTVDKEADFALCQAIDRESSDVRLSGPGGLKLRPESHDQQNAKGANAIYDPGLTLRD